MKKKFENQKLAHDILNIPIGLEVKSEEQASVQRLVVVSNDCDLELQAHKAIVNNDVNLFSYLVENRNIVLTKTNEYGQNILHIAASKGSVEVMKYILNNENIKIEPTATDKHDQNILHIAAVNGNLEMMEYILNNDKINIDPTATYKDDQNILHIAAYLGNLVMIKYILKTGLIDKISSDLYDTLTQQSDSSFTNSIKAIQYLLDDQEYEVDFSKQKFDEDLLLKMFKYYVCRPQLAQHTILELKEIYIKKAKNAQLPEALVDGIPDILNEWAKEIFSQECDLMSQDYTNLHIQLDNLHIQLANRIKPAKKLQDFIESPDDKKETTA